MKLFTFLLVLSLGFFACKPGGNAENVSAAPTSDDPAVLEAQVLAVHDEIMPKMSEITDLNAKLRDFKKSIPEDASGKIESPAGLEEAIGSLKLAEQGMWDWMKQYNDAKATVQPDQLTSFYRHQLELVSKVKTDMLSAIEKAQTWVAAHPNSK